MISQIAFKVEFDNDYISVTKRSHIINGRIIRRQNVLRFE